MNTDLLWKAKLAARLHDPAEKALVLLRDPAGHEGGTSKSLWSLVADGSLPTDLGQAVKKADWWASAADRPQWPMNETVVQKKDGNEASVMTGFWSQVHWTKAPVIVHPLTGKQFDLVSLRETAIQEVKDASLAHHALILKALDQGSSQVNDKLLSLALWRFAPEPIRAENDTGLGELWRLLPADTRVPDHSIWDHLDLTSAFAGAFAADEDKDVALLSLSIGPVQDFIAAARSTSDMWAGSHLLSRLAWETMKPICEQLGPEAILFPRLRGIALVDVWLRDEIGLPDALFAGTGQDNWRTTGTDANPLFTAALPNRFVAIVPAKQAKDIAKRCEQAARNWIQSLGQQTVDLLLEVSELANGQEQYCHQQMREQLADFPDIHWAAIPFSLVKEVDKQLGGGLDVKDLSSVLSNFLDTTPELAAGFLASPAWQVLQKEIVWQDNTCFFSPNPGVLYPVIYDLAERVLAASKATRAFSQSKQKGWRCSLTGESEWLTTEQSQLFLPKGKRGETLWSKVADKKKSWAKEGEYLGALASLKRLWPDLFAAEVASITGQSTQRFVISTHTMALAGHLEAWLERGGLTAQGLSHHLDASAPVALPRRIMRKHGYDPQKIRDAKRIPGVLDAIDGDDSDAYRQAEKLIKRTLSNNEGSADDGARLETYYGMLMFDGDHMGRILAGEQASTAITYFDSFHPRVQEGFKLKGYDNELIQAYAQQKRPITANRHLSISNALNEFAQVVVPHIVEIEHLGRLIYAGGDDVLAMLPTKDVLSAMTRLRDAYSGQDNQLTQWARTERSALDLSDGFAILKDKQKLRLMRMMGKNATASCGAVIAHHQAPLGHVMRLLRIAEKRAKEAGGRDAFSISIIKRSGGDLHLEAKWGDEMALLNETIGFLGLEGTSRRAVYNSTEWLKDLPQPDTDANRALLCHLLGYQFARQSNEPSRGDMPRQLGNRLGHRAATKKDSINWLFNFLSVAEFLARETRLSQTASKSEN